MGVVVMQPKNLLSNYDQAIETSDNRAILHYGTKLILEHERSLREGRIDVLESVMGSASNLGVTPWAQFAFYELQNAMPSKLRAASIDERRRRSRRYGRILKSASGETWSPVGPEDVHFGAADGEEETMDTSREALNNNSGEELIREIQKHLDVYPQDLEAGKMLVWRLVDGKRFTCALAVAEAYILTRDKSIPALIMVAELHATCGDHVSAVELFSAACLQDGGNRRALLGLLFSLTCSESPDPRLVKLTCSKARTALVNDDEPIARALLSAVDELTIELRDKNYKS